MANINDKVFDYISSDGVEPVDLQVQDAVYDPNKKLVSVTVERGSEHLYNNWASDTPVILAVYDVDANRRPIVSTKRLFKALREDNSFTSPVPINAYAKGTDDAHLIKAGMLVRCNIEAYWLKQTAEVLTATQTQLTSLQSRIGTSAGTHAIAHRVNFDSITGTDSDTLYGEGATTNSVLGYKKTLDAKIGLFRPAELHNLTNTGAVIGFDHETGTVRPTMPAGIVSLQVQTGHITLQVVTGSSNLVNSDPANYRLQYREIGGSWNTYDLAKGTPRGGNTPYNFSGTIQELDLAEVYQYRLSVDAGANYLDLHAGEYINDLVDEDNLQEVIASYNAEVAKQIEANRDALTGREIISKIEHEDEADQLQTRFLRGNAYSEEVTTLPAVAGRRAGELIVEKAGTTYSMKYLSLDAAVATPDRNKLTIMTGANRYFRLDPVASDVGSSVRNYNNVLGWYFRRTSDTQYYASIYLRQSMLSSLGITTNTGSTAFRAAITTVGGTKTYIPYVREPASTRIGLNGELYLEYQSSNTTSANVPAGQNTTYDIFFQKPNGDPLNIFPATTPGTKWVTLAGGSTGGGQGTTLSQSQLDAIARVPTQTVLNNIPTAAEKSSFPRIPTILQIAAINRVPAQSVLDNIPTATEKAALPRIPTATTDANKRWGTDDSGVYGWQDETEASSGLDQAAVDARIKAEVDPWALDGNKSKIPKGKVDIQSPRNLVATLSITGTTSAGDIDYGGNTNTGTASFTLESTTFIIKRVFFDSSDTNLAIKLATGTTALTQTQKDLLHSAHFQLNDGTTLDFESLFFKNDVSGAGGVSEYEWSGVPTTGFIAGTNTIKVFLDITENNYVPIPTADEDGDVLTAGTNGTSSWQRPLRGVAESRLRTGVGAGLSLTNLNSFRSTGIQLISPTFDMDDRTGIVIAEATLTINTPSATNLKFVSGTGELTHTLQGWRTIQDLLAVDVFHATNASGVKLDEVDLYLGSVNAGSVELWLERNANNELAYSIQYTNNNSATGSCSLGSTVNILFMPSDAGAMSTASGGGGGSGVPQVITLTTNNTVGTGSLNTASTGDRIRGGRINFPVIPAGTNNYITSSVANNQANFKAGLYRVMVEFSSVYTSGTNDSTKEAGVTVNFVGTTADSVRTFLPVGITGTTAALAPRGIVAEQFAYFPTDQTNIGLRVDARRMGSSLYGLQATVGRIIVVPIGGGGGSSTPAPAGRAFSVVNTRPTADSTFTDSTANTWTSPSTIITAPAITSAQAGGILIKAHIEGEVTVAATSGTDRILLRAMIRRTRGSTTETIDQVEIYLRNMTATNLRSTIGNADLSYIDTAQAGDVYSIQVQQRAQQANKSVIYRMADNLLQVATMGG